MAPCAEQGRGGCALEDHVSVPRFGVLDLGARVRDGRLTTEAAEEAPHRQAMRELPLVLITVRETGLHEAGVQSTCGYACLLSDDSGTQIFFACAHIGVPDMTFAAPSHAKTCNSMIRSYPV